MKDCPCGSNFPFTDCCAPLIRGTGFPDTAEDLMRSRYTAFTHGNWEYLVLTSHPEEKKEMARLGPELIADGVVWQKLEILGTRAGGQEDSQGQVDFASYYTKDGIAQTLRESSRFYKINGRWVYSRKDSTLPPVPVSPQTKPKTVVRDKAKIGRNDPCPCGSGKKYKKCCHH
jgi:SEC-C motif-containing protein